MVPPDAGRPPEPLRPPGPGHAGPVRPGPRVLCRRLERAPSRAGIEPEVCFDTSAVEHGSGHPLGEAIGRKAEASGVPIEAADGFRALKGMGVEGTVGGVRVTVGIPVAAGVLYPLFGIRLDPMVASAAMALGSVSAVTNPLRLKRARI